MKKNIVAILLVAVFICFSGCGLTNKPGESEYQSKESASSASSEDKVAEFVGNQPKFTHIYVYNLNTDIIANHSYTDRLELKDYKIVEDYIYFTTSGGDSSFFVHLSNVVLESHR